MADVYSNGRQPAAKLVDHAAIDARQRELLAQLELDMQMVRLAKQNAVERFLVEADTRMMEIHVQGHSPGPLSVRLSPVAGDAVTSSLVARH